MPDTVGATTGAGRVLAGISTGCLVALAPVMAVAHRSSPLMLTLAAAFAILGAAADRRLAGVHARVAASLASPLGCAVVAFLAWAAMSIVWSADRRITVAALGEFVLPFAAACLLAATRPRLSGAVGLWLAGSLVLAAAIILGDIATGLVYRGLLGMRAALFVLNRPVLTLLVLLPVAVSLAWRDGRRWLAVLVAAMVAAAIMRAQSGAARLGLVALVAVAGITLLSRRAALGLVAAALVGALVLAPVVGDLAEDLVPPSAYRALAAAHAQARADIWRSFGAALRLHPILGEGFGASAHLDRAPVAGEVAPDFATFLGVGHPHNAALQIWVELGAVGAGLAGAVVACLIGACRGLGRSDLAVMLSLMAAALADSLVGQGAWQGWWPASIGAAVIWFRFSHAEDEEAVDEHA